MATVDGDPITVGDLTIAAARICSRSWPRFPPNSARDVVQSVVEIRLFAKAAVTEGLDKTEPVMRRLALLCARALRNEYLINKVAKVVTDEAIRKRFDEDAAKFVAGDELHLYHILVKTEDEAKAIIADLDKGGDFAAIAKEKSQRSRLRAPAAAISASSAKGQMVKPFEDAAFSARCRHLHQDAGADRSSAGTSSS